MAGAAPSEAGGGDDDFVYEGVKLQTAEDYKQHRKVQAILDAQETVLERRETAYEYLWEGRIGQEDYLKAIRMAVERYLMLSKQAIRESEYAQWFWAGEPPTLRGLSPYRLNENDERELIAYREDDEVTLPDDSTRLAGELVSDEIQQRNPKYRLNKPVLRLGDDNKPMFGTEPNILGVMPMPEVDKQLVFQGLESYWECEDPIIRQSEGVEEHPTRMVQATSQTHRYQIPEDVSVNAFDQINDFWWLTGMSVKLDRGQTIIKDFDMSHHQKYVHTDGSPPI